VNQKRKQSETEKKAKSNTRESKVKQKRKQSETENKAK
jgi:hypothetical protein